MSVSEKDSARVEQLIDVRDVATMLSCSSRTIRRLADSARMPRPVRVGALLRWSRAAIEEWFRDGCPPCRRPRARP